MSYWRLFTFLLWTWSFSAWWTSAVTSYLTFRVTLNELLEWTSLIVSTWFSLWSSASASSPPQHQTTPNLWTSNIHCMLPGPVFADLYNPGAKDLVDIPPPPIPMIAPPPIPPPAGPCIDELVQQSQWNLQQQEQHLHTLRQVQSKALFCCSMNSFLWY